MPALDQKPRPSLTDVAAKERVIEAFTLLNTYSAHDSLLRALNLIPLWVLMCRILLGETDHALAFVG
jgi:hypothetical protein